MNKHLVWGIVVGAAFTILIGWVAVSDTLATGGLALLASAVFGLAAGLCIGALIAANFAMLAFEESNITRKSRSKKKPMLRRDSGGQATFFANWFFALQVFA